jgi:hypothetical protein
MIPPKDACLTFVSPGKSTIVSVSTLGEKMRKLMGCGEIPTRRDGYFSYTIHLRPLTNILASLELGISNNLVTDLVKVVELFARQVEEFTPFVRIFIVVGFVIRRLGFSRRSVDKLENL